MGLLNTQGEALARLVQQGLVRAGMKDVTVLSMQPSGGRRLVLRSGSALHRVQVLPVGRNPTTPVVGGARDLAGQSYAATYGPPGSARLPDFHQLDLRIDKRWVYRRVSINAYLDVLNVYNHQNTEFWIYSYDFSGRRPVTGLPIIPSLGTKLEF